MSYIRFALFSPSVHVGYDVMALKTPMVTTELMVLTKTADAVSVCATRYCVASLIAIGTIGTAVVNTASLSAERPVASARRVTKTSLFGFLAAKSSR